MMRRRISTVAVTLLLAAAVFVPVVFLRPAAETPNAGAATQPPGASSATKPSPTPASDDANANCGSAMVSFDAADPTIANLAEGARWVVIASVDSIGAARWNTDDGKAPAFSENPPMDAYIYQPVILSVAAQARGAVLGAAIQVNALGGTVGCYRFTFEHSPVLKSGQEYAFFLGPARSDDGTLDKSTMTINRAWPVSAGLIETPLEGDVPISAFIADVEAAPLGPLGD